MDKETWVNEVFTPFDQGAREQFFLSATGFLYSNFQERLASGYYMEFGCYKARSMRHCYRHTQHNFNLKYLAFDSFSGLPAVTGLDVAEEPFLREGDFSMSETAFRRTCNDAGIPTGSLETIEGYYEAVLTPALQNRFLPRKATIAYVDCDLYESTRVVLEFLVPFFQLGTIIAFDDWNLFLADPHKGQRRAWSEFGDSHQELRFEHFFSTHQLASFVCVSN